MLKYDQPRGRKVADRPPKRTSNTIGTRGGKKGYENFNYDNDDDNDNDDDDNGDDFNDDDGDSNVFSSS